MACPNADVPAVLLSQSDAEASVLCLINEERANAGVGPLTLNLTLRDVAREHATAASAIKWWDPGGPIVHTNPQTHKNEQDRIREAGYCPIDPQDVPRNENAYASWYTGDQSYATGTTPRAAVEWWMNSPAHRDTLLDPQYRETGVGVIRGTAVSSAPAGADGAIFVQDFGGCDKVEPAVDTLLWGWGGNANGQVGDGSGSPEHRAPVHPADFESFVGISAGHHSIGVKADGTVWTWGPRENKGPYPGGSDVPVQVPGISQATAVAAGYEHNLAIASDSTVWAWGDNRWGQIGDGSGQDQEVPVRVPGLTGVVAVAAGQGHSLALKHDGTLWAWGGNYQGQLGIGSYDDQKFPVQVPHVFNGPIAAIAAGEDHTVVVEKGSGQMWLWGTNMSGCLGTGMLSFLGSKVPLKPDPIGDFTGDGIVSVAAGFANSYAADRQGRVWAWGSNWFDQLGPGHTHILEDPSAYQIAHLDDVVRLDAGSFHCLALKRDKTLWGWGSNSVGQLGLDVPTGPSQPPRRVSRLITVTIFSAGHVHSLAIAEGDRE